MHAGIFRISGAAVGLACTLLAARPAHAAAATDFSSTDFTLTLSRLDSSGNATALSDTDLGSYFSAARCACPTDVVATLTLGSDAATRLGTADTLTAQITVGNDCDNAAATGCTTFGSSLTLTSTTTSAEVTLSSASFFPAGSCTQGASSTQVWAVVRLSGTRISSQPSLSINLGGSGPVTPTSLTAVTASEGLLVSWVTTADASTIRGHQLFCSPAPAAASAAAFETCSALPASGSGPFASLDASLICSGLVAVGTNSVRVHGLTNGTTYQIAVVAVGNDDTPSAPSAVVSGTPAQTVGFEDLYSADGGTAQQGCSVAPGRAPRIGTAGAGLVILLVAGGRRRRRRSARRWRGAVAASACLLAGAAARADPAPEPTWGISALSSSEAPRPARGWNLELRFGPYRPDVDQEFAARGSAARPYAQIFSSSQNLLMQLELDRQVLHRWGTWAVGATGGYTRASAAALAADLTTRTGDQTALTVVPVSLALVYRADQLRDYEPIGIIPYAKLGLDCAFWSISQTSGSGASGRTFGWHSALGLSIDLASFDPEIARTIDADDGVKQFALFMEYDRLALDGFGSGSVLHVGDNTWMAGLMLAF